MLADYVRRAIAAGHLPRELEFDLPNGQPSPAAEVAGRRQPRKPRKPRPAAEAVADRGDRER